MNDKTYQRVAKQLQKITPANAVSISPETEIYADLKMYGDDLFEFLVWINKDFDVQVVVAGRKYAPSEMPFLKLVEAFKKVTGCGGNRYKSLKVRDVVEAIDAGGRQFD